MPSARQSRRSRTWLDIEVTTQEYLSDLQRQVETLTATLPVEVLLLRRSREQRQQSLARLDNETLSELKVEEVLCPPAGAG
ncbi:Nuclease sbcCD subunit D [Pantoea agglomerans]|uniref:Nuclease sbcCD subunit D n=1 Tax=Enterobacter agglomerans TaxID=549 RepID=A0A379AJP8_ENTAG|nr:Nuclease sbcCD subunit D [Pantoea agglomerans]